jgi:hypothetical protein
MSEEGTIKVTNVDTANGDGVMVSRHPDGKVFLYTYTFEERAPSDRAMTLVLLNREQAITIGSAMLGPEADVVTFKTEPEYMRDAPPVLDDDQIDALMDEPEDIDEYNETVSARERGDMLGYERGYTAGFEDGCRYAYDGGDQAETDDDGNDYENTRRIISLETALYERDQINGTTFETAAERFDARSYSDIARDGTVE